MNRYFSMALGALTAGAMGLSVAPAANATCASAFGFGISAQCSSTPTTIAIAIGTGATAHADGVLSTAMALGNGAGAGAYGWFGSAMALGNDSAAVTGNLAVAVAAGTHSGAHAGAASTEMLNLAISLGSSDAEAYGGIGNVAMNLLGKTSQVFSIGTGDVAMNTGNSSSVIAMGKLSNATNLGGFSVYVSTSSTSVAGSVFNLFGSSNIVQSDKGPLAIAGSIGQTNGLVKQLGTGININGHVVGGAAATQPTPAAAKHTAAQGLAADKRKHH